VNRNRIISFAVGLIGAGFVSNASAASISLTNNDAGGTTSFNLKGHWDSDAAPNPANDYVVQNLLLRTPQDNNSYTFQGRSLTIIGDGFSGLLALKGTAGGGSTYTFGSSAETGLTLDGGTIGMWNGTLQVVDGYINLTANGGQLDPQANAPLTIAADISGPGALRIGAAAANGATGGRVLLTGTNTYTGGTVLNARDTLQLGGGSTLGSTTAPLTIENSNNNRGWGTLDLNGTSQSVGSLSGGGGTILNNAAGTASTLTIGNGNTGGGEFMGNLVNGNGNLALAKIGTATISLSGTNTYTGVTTISGGTLQVSRINSPLAGNGRLVLMQSPTNVISRVDGTNGFTGTIVVKAGWLTAATNGSFGTNDITVDPAYILDASFSGFAVDGPAVFEPGYNVNSAGTLTLINGGRMALHQNCAFAAVNIEGTPLAPGTHFYSALAAAYPNTFLPGGSGAITVQPFGTLPPIGPLVQEHPADLALYAGRTASFSVSAVGEGTVSYQWRKGGVNLANSGTISGVNTPSLLINNVATGNAGNYDVVVSNFNGSSTSVVAQLTVVLPEDAVGNSVLGVNPIAFYRLNETEDTSTGTAVAHDFAGGFNGVYGAITLNALSGVSGPAPEIGYPGFASPNGAVQFLQGYADSQITVEPWRITTNSLTIVAWINPAGPQGSANGIVFHRGTNVAGFNYSTATDVNGNYTLGYTWNNDANTYGWNSGVIAPQNVWSLAALVVTPTNATIYVINTSSLVKSSRAYTHVAQTFNGTTMIGNDPFAPANRGFNGTVDDVAIFGGALSESQLTTLFSAGSGVSLFIPSITSEPASQNLYEQQTATFTVVASGTAPLHYQWQKWNGSEYASIANGGRISGATSASLTITNITAADAGDYVVVVTNSLGSAVSATVTLSVMPASPAEDITLSVVQGNPQDWNTGEHWSDGLAASNSAVAKPGSRYFIASTGAMRTPATGASAAFPGEILTVQGNGVFANPPGTGAGAVILKGSNPSTVHFKKLVMAGGQLFNFINSGGSAILTGEMNVIANTPIFATEDTSSRSITLQSQLTGNGTIEYRAHPNSNFQSNWVAALNIAGANNTYSGTWNIVVGTVIGSGAGSLGTNNILVGAQGALQASYDIVSPAATLTLNGRLNLTRNHTFGKVVINGVELAAGTYTAAQLNSAYPANFPASWRGQTGALDETTASGSLTVLSGGVPAVNVGTSFAGGKLNLTWSQGSLMESTNLAGPWTTNSAATSPHEVTPAGPQKFFKILVR